MRIPHWKEPEKRLSISYDTSPIGDKMRTSLKIGISGVRGIIGESLPHFCFFGDTMNFAARMETNSAPNRLQVGPGLSADRLGSAR